MVVSLNIYVLVHCEYIECGGGLQRENGLIGVKSLGWGVWSLGGMLQFHWLNTPVVRCWAVKEGQLCSKRGGWYDIDHINIWRCA